METWEWICCHPCLTWGHASQASISSCCDGGFAVPRKKERKNKKEELSGTARSLLSCARSQKCHRVIEWSSAGSCESEKGDSPPSVGGKVNQSCFMSGLGLCSSLKLQVSSPHFERSAKKKKKNMRAAATVRKTKAEVYLPLWPDVAASPAKPRCLARRQRKSTLPGFKVSQWVHQQGSEFMLFAHYLEAQNCWWQAFLYWRSLSIPSVPCHNQSSCFFW